MSGSEIRLICGLSAITCPEQEQETELNDYLIGLTGFAIWAPDDGLLSIQLK